MAKSKKEEEVQLSVIEQCESVKDLIKNTSGIIEIKDVDAVTKQLTELSKKYDGFEVTKETFEAAKEARRELQKPRFDLQNIQKANISTIEEGKKEMKGVYSTLIEIVSPQEKRIDEGIKKVEKLKEKEKEEKRLAEQKRINDIKDEIQKETTSIANIYDQCVSVRSTEKLDGKIDHLKNNPFDFSEYQFQIDDLVEKYEDKLPGLKEKIESAIAAEKEQKRISEENEKLRLEQVKSDVENYQFLFQTYETLGGDDKDLIRTIENPPTKKDSTYLQNQIQILSAPKPEPKEEKIEPKAGEPGYKCPIETKKPVSEFEKAIDETIKSDKKDTADLKAPEKPKEEVQETDDSGIESILAAERAYLSKEGFKMDESNEFVYSSNDGEHVVSMDFILMQYKNYLLENKIVYSNVANIM